MKPKRAKPARPRSNSWGTPKQPAQHAQIFSRVFDGNVWEIAPEDHMLTPRRFAEELKTYAAHSHMQVMIEKRDHYIYVQRLDVEHDNRDRDVRALRGRPYLQRWLLGGYVAPEPKPEPEPEPTTEETPQEIPRETETVMASSLKPKRVNGKYLLPERTEPFVLTIMNRYFDKSLTVNQVQRLIEPLIEEAGVTQPTHYLYVAQCLRDLVADPETLLFSRYNQRGEFGKYTAGGKPSMLYSPTDPVPRWDPTLHEEILRTHPVIKGKVRDTEARAQVTTPEVPANLDHEAETTAPLPVQVDPRNEQVIVEQPKYRVMAPSAPSELINGFEGLQERFAQLTHSMATMIVEIEHKSHGDENLRDENERLKAENVRLRHERDSAVAQLQAIAQAQRTISDLLGGRVSSE